MQFAKYPGHVTQRQSDKISQQSGYRVGEHILIEHVHKDLLGWQEVDNEDLDG